MYYCHIRLCCALVQGTKCGDRAWPQAQGGSCKAGLKCYRVSCYYWWVVMDPIPCLCISRAMSGQSKPGLVQCADAVQHVMWCKANDALPMVPPSQ